MTENTATVNPVVTGPVRSALVGVVFGVDAVGHCLALATLCFAGALSSGLGAATAVFLFGTALSTLILYNFGSFRLPLSISQDTTISIIAPAIVLASVSVVGSEQAQIGTAFAIIGTSAALSGVMFWLVGTLGLGSLLRMFPYPVSAGFLASSGYLLVFAGLSVSTHAPDAITIIKALLTREGFLLALPSVVMATTMLMSLRKWQGTTAVLMNVALFLAGYYVVSFLSGFTHADAVAAGWVPDLASDGPSIVGIGLITSIDWLQVIYAAPTICVVVLLNLIGLLLNTSGVELATQQTANENKELRITGLANIAIGLFGGLTAYLQGGATIITHKMNVHPKAMITGLVITVIAGAFLAPIMIGYIPTFIPAALLIFVGVSMLEDWIVNSYKRLLRLDWLIVVGIVAISAVFGILTGIVMGLLLALIGFAYMTIRLPVVRVINTGVQRRSIRDRSAIESEMLEKHGDAIQVFYLQGSLFFGSIEKVIIALHQTLDQNAKVQALILDFTDVHTVDSSACAALDKLAFLLKAKGVNAHLTGVSTNTIEIMARWGLSVGVKNNPAGTESYKLWDSLEAALAQAETSVMEVLLPALPNADIAKIIHDLAREHPRTADLIAKMARIDLVKGERLISAAEKSFDVFFLLKGRIGIYLPSPTGPGLLVRSMGPGAIVGEIAYVTGLPRNADVYCEEDAQILCLNEAHIRNIEITDRDLTSLMLTIFSRSIAAKLSQANTLLTYHQKRPR